MLRRALLLCLPAMLLAGTAAAGTIRGVVHDQAGRPAAGVCVILCDGASGLPLARDAWKPFTRLEGDMEAGMQRCLFQVSGPDGAFQFQNVPAGEYRLLGQAWPDAGEVTNLFEVNGKTVRLHGTASLTLTDDAVAETTLGPPGDRVLFVDVDAGNDESLLVIGATPTRADPILGFAGWVGPFNASALGGNRMPDGVTRVEGLPATTVHLAVFSADNSPGWGRAEVDLTRSREVRVLVPFVASWSDGVHSPRPELAPLTQKLAAAGEEAWVKLRQAITEAGVPEPRSSHPLASMAAMADVLDHKVTLDGVGEHPLGDLLAAAGYAQMQRMIKERGREPNPWRPAEIVEVEAAAEGQSGAGDATRKRIREATGLSFSVLESYVRRNIISTDSPYGFKAASVEPESPAAEAGLRPGDVVLTWAGRPIRSLRELSGWIAETGTDDPVAITFARHHKRSLLSRNPWREHEVTLTLGVKAES